MSRFSRGLRFVLIIGVIAAVSLLLTGCFEKNTGVQRSQAGYLAEEFLPSTTPLVVSYSTLDKDQRDVFTVLQAKLPQLGDQSVEQKFADGLGFTAWNFGDLAFTQQLATLLANGTRISFAMDSLPKAQETSSDVTIPGKYVFAVVNDAAATKTLLDQVASASNGTVTGVADSVTQMPLYEDPTDQIFVGLVGDLLLMSDNETLLKDAIARGVQKTDSLANADAYKDAMAKLTDSYVASVYFAADANPFQTLSASETPGPVVGEGFVFVAENDGLKIEGYSKADEAALKTLGIDRNAFAADHLTLVNKLPGQDVVFATESKNLAGVINLLMNVIAKQQTAQIAEDGTATPPEDFYVAFKTKFKNFMELDWDTDVLTFLDQNYTFALSTKQGNIIPGITIMADASSNVTGAQKLIEKIDTQLEGLLMILRLNAGTAGTDLFVKDTVQVGGAEAHRISVDFTKLAALTGGATTVPDVVSSQKFELTYGVTGDNVFFLSTQPDFAIGYGSDVLSNQENYKKLESHVDLKNGVFFMAPATMATYLDTIVSFQESLNGPLAPEDQATFDEAKAFLQAFQSVMLTAEMDGDVTWTHGYVLVGQ